MHTLVGRRVSCPHEHSGREMAVPEVKQIINKLKKMLYDTSDDCRLIAENNRVMGACRNSVDNGSCGVPTVDPLSRKRVFEAFRVMNLETFAHWTFRLYSTCIIHH